MSEAKLNPEQQARERIDYMLDAVGWVLQDKTAMNLYAGQGVAVREFSLKSGHGFADYLLFVDAQAVGVLEAKPVGHTLTGVEVQAKKYATGLPDGITAPVKPLPFLYLSTGAITRFTNLLDPHPRSREVFAIHRPETIAEWLTANTLDAWVKASGSHTAADDTRISTLRSRIRTLPGLEQGFLYPNQVRAIVKLEASLKQDRPRSLIQMATGSGKTKMAITAIYRLIKFADARRVLFLVDRSNLGEQAEKEFQGYRSPDDNRKFTELYKVQRLTTNTIGSSSKVVISTIQRLYSMLRGDADFDAGLEEGSLYEASQATDKPVDVAYNPVVPPETFDVIVVDECHRSIYTIWGQVLEYFDAYLIGLTATPAVHTYGFFNQNLVMEYLHEQAVADGVNVDFEVYPIRTRITTEGATVRAGKDVRLKIRNLDTREVRWKKPDEDLKYEGKDLDRDVVAKDQIRLIARTFRDRLPTEIFPGRKEIPKTLVFAKDDSHAEDIVGVFREEFAWGNEECQKITYKTTGDSPRDLIQAFRNQYYPRIAVTVDMVATGTDIRPVEIVLFMRFVKSRLLFEQMKGRGVRIIDPDELKAVTPDAVGKTHFIVVDCVGITESKLSDSQQLERDRSIPLKDLLGHVAMGGTDLAKLSTLASRLARLAKRCTTEQDKAIREVSGGPGLSQLSRAIIDALNPDAQVARARADNELDAKEEPTPDQIKKAYEALAREATKPIATKPKLREEILKLSQRVEQTIDEVSKDELLFAGFSEEATWKAKELVTSFESFLEEHREEIEALQVFYSEPYKRRPRFKDIKEIAKTIQAPPRSWTPEALWRAYEVLNKDSVRGASAQRLLTDVVSLVRFALHQDEELVPYREQVHERFENWMAQQENEGRKFSEEQVRWLQMIRDHVATSLEMEMEDFDYAPFAEEGGLGRASKVFGGELGSVLKQLNEVLAA